MTAPTAGLPDAPSGEMSIYNDKMDISVTEFKQRCLELIRQVEETGKPVTITRRGRAVAQLDPPVMAAATGVRPWERLRGRARWLAEPGERFISEKDIRGL
jgi:prevent-host-death family protein